MGKGYHSRSPEEFREYLDNLKKHNTKPYLKHLIVFIDILIILVIFYIVSQIISPGTTFTSQKSESHSIPGLAISLSLSQIEKKEGARLYMVIQNHTGTLQEVPKNWTLAYNWTTTRGEVCLAGNLDMLSPPRPLAPESTGLLELWIPPPAGKDGSGESPVPECQKKFFRERGRFGLGAFRKRILLLQIHLKDQAGNQADFTLEVNPYP